jgi:ParB-like chromosome segregation protein Spo0J
MLSQHDRILDGHYRVKIANELGIDYPRDVREVADDYEAQDLALTLQLGRDRIPLRSMSFLSA